jgi:site-specific recombinase XerC
VSEHTRRAYTHDVDEFVAWCERGGCKVAAELDHRALRRYFSYLRRAGSEGDDLAQGRVGHAYVRFLRRHGVVSRDVASGFTPPAASKKLPRFRAATMRSRCSTASPRPTPTIRACGAMRRSSSSYMAPGCA